MKAPDSPNGARREFIKRTVAMPVALTAAVQGCADASGKPVERPKLPRIRLGDHWISRLVCEANPFNGGSHLSTFVNRQMKEYYTEEQVFKTLQRCQQVGINCWQSGNDNCQRYRRFVDRGLDMRYISIEHAKSTPLTTLSECGCIGVAHHGEVTDSLFKSGQLDQINEYLKRLRDSGLQVGVSTHMPDVIDAIES